MDHIRVLSQNKILKRGLFGTDK